MRCALWITLQFRQLQHSLLCVWVILQVATLRPSSSCQHTASSPPGCSGNANHLLQQPSHAQAASAACSCPLLIHPEPLQGHQHFPLAPCCSRGPGMPRARCSETSLQHRTQLLHRAGKGMHRGCPSSAKPPEPVAGPAAMCNQPTAVEASTRAQHRLPAALCHGKKAAGILARPGGTVSLPQLRAALPPFQHSPLLSRNGFWRLISCLSSFLQGLWPPSWCCSVLGNTWNHENLLQLQDLLAQVCICQCLCFGKNVLAFTWFRATEMFLIHAVNEERC